MLHIAVCDDEILFVEKIEQIVSEYLDDQHMEYEIDDFRSGEEFAELDQNMEKYDIVFMDINMDNIDGIETAKIMRKICPNTFLIFVTAFINYTLEGYKVEAIRYILKDYETLSENIKEGDYKNAVSDDELDDLLKTITEYYQKKLSWEIIDYRIADNDHSLYQLYTDYELGNIIVFEVHTTNNPSGLYRAIVLGRKKDKTKWKVLNEGV